MQNKFLNRRRRAAAIVVPVVLAASAAVVAGANMASASPQPGSLAGTGGTIYYSAGTGTLNNIVVRNAAAGGIEVEDLNGEIQLANPFGGCNGNDTVHGGAGDDTLKGSNDDLFGDDGDDRFLPADWTAYHGGNGIDTMDYSG